MAHLTKHHRFCKGYKLCTFADCLIRKNDYSMSITPSHFPDKSRLIERKSEPKIL